MRNKSKETSLLCLWPDVTKTENPQINILTDGLMNDRKLTKADHHGIEASAEVSTREIL